MRKRAVRTIGVTSSRFAECKRGLAANLAAALARAEAPQCAVAVVDADPVSNDVSVRLGDPLADHERASVGTLRTRIHQMRWPLLHVVVCEPAEIDERSLARAADAIARTRDVFDRTIVDLPAGCGRPGLTLDAGVLEHLDALIIATTASGPAVAATRRHLELIERAQAAGHIAASLDVRVVVTGDEASATLDLDSVLEDLGPMAHAFAGSVVQLWGRTAPNAGFGPTLGVPSLDGAMAAILASVDHERGTFIDLAEWRSRSSFTEPSFA